MIAFDLHIHTNFSPCSNMSPMVVLQTAQAAGLSAIAITDHNTTAGAVEAHRLLNSNRNMFRNFQLFTGIEFKTKYGEFNAVFLSPYECATFESMPRDERGRFYLPELISVISAMKASGSEIMTGLNHPISLSSFNKRGGFDFDGVFRDGVFPGMRSLMVFFDWVEINGMNIKKAESDKALEMARSWERPAVFGSDSHWKRNLGRYGSIGSYSTPRESVLAAQAGDPNAITLPSDVAYWKNGYYRAKSAILRDLKNAVRRK